MATAERMQEALQQLQVLTARVAALETQLQFEPARAQTAEQEREARRSKLWERFEQTEAAAWSIRRRSDSPSCGKGLKARTSANGHRKCARSCLQGSEMR